MTEHGAKTIVEPFRNVHATNGNLGSGSEPQPPSSPAPSVSSSCCLPVYHLCTVSFILFSLLIQPYPQQPTGSWWPRSRLPLAGHDVYKSKQRSTGAVTIEARNVHA